MKSNSFLPEEYVFQIMKLIYAPKEPRYVDTDEKYISMPQITQDIYVHQDSDFFKDFNTLSGLVLVLKYLDLDLEFVYIGKIDVGEAKKIIFNEDGKISLIKNEKYFLDKYGEFDFDFGFEDDKENNEVKVRHFGIHKDDYQIIIDKVNIIINKYFEKYKNGELKISNKNYFNFEKCKDLFFNDMKEKKYIEEIGKKFILKKKLFSTSFGDTKVLHPEYLFFHTLFILQREGYFMIESFGLNQLREDGFGTQAEVSIELNDIFLDEYDIKFNGLVKNNAKSKNIFFKSYDEYRKVLSFSLDKVNLAKKGKDTDDIKLLEILLSDTEKTWYTDEIKEKFGYGFDEKIAKNKFYYAKNNLNEKVDKQVGITDFIDGNTTEFKINDKYLRVDE